MKRIICIFVCIFLVFGLLSNISFASAEDTKALEKVLADVKTRIPDTSVFPEFDSSIHIENGKTIYSFTWGGDSFRSMYVSALASGVIIEYGFFEEIVNQAPVPGFDRISTDEAVLKTQVLINKLNPSIAGKLFVEAYPGPENFKSDTLSFKLVHKEGGVPVQNDTGRVAVDINAEKITSFRITYTEQLAYVSPHNILSQLDAKKAFEENLGLTLSYRTYKDFESRTIKVFPAYSDENGSMYLDANTGKATEIKLYYDIYFSKNESANDTITGGNGGGFSDAESKELENVAEILSSNEAERLLRSIKVLNITGDYAVEESSVRKNIYYENRYIRTMVFRSTNAGKSAFIHVEIDAATGEIQSFSNFSSESINGSTLSKDKLKTAADEFIAYLAPDKYTEYILDDTIAASSGYFTYTRHVNNVPVFGDTISVELSTTDLDLISYRINYTDVNFPTLDNIIPHNTACEKFFEHTSYTPLYIPQKSDESLKNTDTTTLVFSTEGSGILLDAYSGNRITSSGAAYENSDEFTDYTDIEGHYAEEKIKALHRFGIGFSGSSFHPDRMISQGEFLDIANQALGTAFSVSDLKSPPADILTRIEAARLICRALKIDKYAEIESIFSCPFSDVESGKGYVSLLWGLGIVNGTDKTHFSPKDGLTRAQAAIILYNTMDKTM